LWARQHRGAIYGQGVGPQGNSYAIPTKDGRNRANLRDPAQTLSIDKIREGVEGFLDYAFEHPELMFEVAPIGCGLAGYVPDQIAPLFVDFTPNIKLPPEFMEVLSRKNGQKLD
jgi:hypothetical protein